MNTQQITTYRVGASWDKQVGGEVHIRDLTPMSVSMPVDHGGDGINPCPIELMISALGSCFLGTFLVFQRQLRLQLQDVKVSAQGSVELITEGEDRGKYDLKEVELFVHIKAVGDEFEEVVAEDCIRMTKEHCPVSRTLRKAAPIIVKSKIEILPD